MITVLIVLAILALGFFLLPRIIGLLIAVGAILAGLLLLIVAAVLYVINTFVEGFAHFYGCVRDFFRRA